jgi:hypothetical protein
VTSYKIHLNASEGLYTPLEHRMGQWVEENQLFSFSTLAVLIISGRYGTLMLLFCLMCDLCQQESSLSLFCDGSACRHVMSEVRDAPYFVCIGI